MTRDVGFLSAFYDALLLNVGLWKMPWGFNATLATSLPQSMLCFVSKKVCLRQPIKFVE